MSRRHLLDSEPDRRNRPDAGAGADGGADRQPAPESVEPGMVVETTEGDLGERDISRPRVKDVVRDEAGNVREVVVEKGVVFKKEIDVPADRIAGVEPPPDGNPADGEVVLATREPEIESGQIADEGMCSRVALPFVAAFQIELVILCRIARGTEKGRLPPEWGQMAGFQPALREIRACRLLPLCATRKGLSVDVPDETPIWPHEMFRCHLLPLFEDAHALCRRQGCVVTHSAV